MTCEWRMLHPCCRATDCRYLMLKVPSFIADCVLYGCIQAAFHSLQHKLKLKCCLVYQATIIQQPKL
ncbi:hypothetical protein XELAEV_18015423mg [Xenopus laevis]|uniref:Uncharacterized protein n=1 Tax=Xenopus laevis TaxID=8355 RepID=A0A974DHY7_XENLA|nr:hypothetical protein XELAEV_18015423mg [Xenopus laevis]